jgi:hypothetical protein
MSLKRAFGPRMNAKDAKKNEVSGVYRGISDLAQAMNGAHRKPSRFFAFFAFFADCLPN